MLYPFANVHAVITKALIERLNSSDSVSEIVGGAKEGESAVRQPGAVEPAAANTPSLEPSAPTLAMTVASVPGAMPNGSVDVETKADKRIAQLSPTEGVISANDTGSIVSGNIVLGPSGSKMEVCLYRIAFAD
jgi:hypothetical protein